MSVRPPDGYPAVSPYLIVPGVARLIEFLQSVFDAREQHRFDRPDGTVMHAEVRIAGQPVLMGEPTPEWPPMPGSLYVYVEDCDAVYRRALEAGGESVMEPATMPHAGDRYGGVRDPSGNVWWIATHVEDVSAEEMKRRIESLSWKQGA